MTNLITRQTEVFYTDPWPPVVYPLEGAAEESFSIEVSGLGQLTGLSYTVPAHASGTIKANLQISALTSEDVKNLNALALSMLSASVQETVREQTKTSTSAELTLWTWFFGNAKGSASYESTYESMRSMGLTTDQITKLMEAFLDRASKMSTVEINFFINNLENDYSVSGDLYLYTVSGTVKTQKSTQQYRMLADQAAAGGPPPTGGGAPSTGNIIKL
ncbi:hypothetical protein [Nocardia sp. alder85J]|uniref:hypothetical protein n=1 Tax=Nocardia sp. alder85J TaxID=2862949 RepID=UPI001CD7AC70|nr:hypothetical protein [Nocardia sp. alder85J]MCX4092953.1 hypothetical protein [Nocardia sp. alder85J]